MFKRIVRMGFLLGVMLCLCGCQLSPQPPEPAVPTTGPLATPLEHLPGDLVSLSFSERASFNKRVQGYDFRNEDGKHTAYFWMANEEEPYSVTVDQAWVDMLTRIIHHHNMLLWDGFSGSADELLDGTHFFVEFALSDGTTVRASGYGCFPDGYGNASEEIDAHFMQLLPEKMHDW